MQEESRRGPFFQLSPAPCLILRGGATIVAANRAWERLGYDPQELVGRPLERLLYPSSAPAILEWLGDLESAAGDPHDTEIRAAGGTWLAHTLMVAAGDGGDEIALLAQPKIAGESDDLRARAESALANWQALSSSLADFVVTADVHGVVETLNRDPPGIPPDQLIGQPDSFFTPIAPSDRPALRARFEHVVQTGESVTYETQVAYPDGNIGTFHSRLAPIRGAQGIIGVVLVTRDITAQRRAEAAREVAERSLREYMRQLERSNSELERFASVASHDLQEPLRKIQAFSERLDRKFQADLPQTGRDYIARMQEAARRMQNLINDLLMFSRLSTKGQQVIEVDLDRTLRTVVSDLEVRIEESGGRVEVGPMPVIFGDPTRLRQLFQNLIANAIKFRRPEEAPIVKITSSVEGEGEDAVAHITVRDNGIGIEAGYRERIFGIFERLHGRGKYEGTGIGLAICRKICEQHGGTIEVGEPDGPGTLFKIELPVRAIDKKARA
ncbi:MAG: PAS domain-containing protein [Myxococcales bacterium]|nr:PAS domain-containing protein [Myxococcales bacterium]MCB9703702.1 PAS domain-containing protein [Myxococcales bacterium]